MELIKSIRVIKDGRWRCIYSTKTCKAKNVKIEVCTRVYRVQADVLGSEDALNPQDRFFGIYSVI